MYNVNSFKNALAPICTKSRFFQNLWRIFNFKHYHAKKLISMIFQHIYFGLIPFCGFVVPFKGKRKICNETQHKFDLKWSLKDVTIFYVKRQS